MYSAPTACAHVSMADEAHRIGPGPVRDSYLSIANILEAARTNGPTLSSRLRLSFGER